MYLTPLVNKLQSNRPSPSPISRRKSMVSRSTSTIAPPAEQGWWDFGDGTALEPFDHKLDIVKHTYARAGDYSVRLTFAKPYWRGKRSRCSGEARCPGVTAASPEIVAFEVKPITADQRVPAVYRLIGKAKAATHCILSVSDDRPMEILDAASNLERYVTFNDMGSTRFG